jgi:hypothetical protein
LPEKCDRSKAGTARIRDCRARQPQRYARRLAREWLGYASTGEALVQKARAIEKYEA